ncbi:MAG: type II toxin-antitoxin system VapC family toxin [Desulfobacterales bacterium]|nr:type II toxin-antitoxin system VapC family toxin [Desulfobacterales bacterium]
MRYLIDTNVWIDALSGKLAASAFLKFSVQASWAGYSAITRLELLGYPGLKYEEELKINELLNAFTEIAVDSNIIDKAIFIRKGIRIKVPDAIIAATALEKNCSLVTRNVEDFKGIIDLDVIDPHAI